MNGNSTNGDASEMGSIEGSITAAFTAMNSVANAIIERAGEKRAIVSMIFGS